MSSSDKLHIRFDLVAYTGPQGIVYLSPARSVAKRKRCL